MSQDLLTETVSFDEGSRRWRAELAGALGAVHVTLGEQGAFRGRIRTTPVGFVRVSDLEADAQSVGRTETHVSTHPDPFVAFAIQERGTAVLVQGGRRAVAGPGELFVWDTARPYTLSHPTSFAARIVRLPRRAAGLTEADLRAVTGTVIGTAEGLGGALRTLLTSLVAAGEPRSAAIADMSAESVVNLFRALVAECGEPSDGRRTDGGAGRGHLLARIRAHIDDHLADPDLSPGTVARAHHISVRYLHRLFEAEGITVARFIRRRRLEQCARELARRSVSPPTVSSIAQRWGFVNAAHFSRTFRAEHGHSPVQWRALRTAPDRGAVGLTGVDPHSVGPHSVGPQPVAPEVLATQVLTPPAR
ncbi:helix-turn-helix domain-containing protein [Streptomyces sp. NPDC002057]|uniref:AraC-like ligand-binding domain-containing protein n=1 Tax=Streptomyces sp. NPDC002057 TaxID=3154664 RepID=UPI003324B55D